MTGIEIFCFLSKLIQNSRLNGIKPFLSWKLPKHFSKNIALFVQPQRKRRFLIFCFLEQTKGVRKTKTWVLVLSFTEWTQMEQGNCKMHRISVQLKVFYWRFEWKLIRLSSPLRSLIPAKQSALIFMSFVVVRTNRKSKNLPQFTSESVKFQLRRRKLSISFVFHVLSIKPR